MNEKYYAIIMAGGVGSRFWPLSRQEHPKQFIDLLGTGETLFQKTFKRYAQIIPKENIYIVANRRYKDFINEQTGGISDEQILLEPYPRNTAPCIAYASCKILKRDPDALIVASPSDHVIQKPEVFNETITEALNKAAAGNNLITIGIKPDQPATGYGYIQFDEEQRDGNFYKVKTFTEKPDQELAEYFLKTGEFLWNSGIFVWSAKAIKEAFKYHLPDLHDIFFQREGYFFTASEQEKVEEAYELCSNVSIDYGIMEKAENVCVIPAEFPWSDLGTWKSLFDFLDKDENNNAVKAENHLIRNSENCVVNTSGEKLVVLNSVKNLIVVESNGILMVADLDKEQEVRQIVNEVKINWGDLFS